MGNETKLNKKCNTCGHIHTQEPSNARQWKEQAGEVEVVIGSFWECVCKSTMFLKVPGAMEKLKSLALKNCA